MQKKHKFFIRALISVFMLFQLHIVYSADVSLKTEVDLQTIKFQLVNDSVGKKVATSKGYIGGFPFTGKLTINSSTITPTTYKNKKAFLSAETFVRNVSLINSKLDLDQTIKSLYDENYDILEIETDDEIFKMEKVFLLPAKVKIVKAYPWMTLNKYKKLEPNKIVGQMILFIHLRQDDEAHVKIMLQESQVNTLEEVTSTTSTNYLILSDGKLKMSEMIQLSPVSFEAFIFD